MSFDAIQFCVDYKIPFWTSGKNVTQGWCNIQCPLCEDNSQHGGFNPGEGSYHCWKCGGHKLNAVISKLLSVSWEKSEKIISEYSSRARVMKKPRRASGGESIIIDMPGEPLGHMHRAYLRKRGFDSDYLEVKYGLKGTGMSGDWKYRLMIPFHIKKRLVSYQGRDVTDLQEIRYKTLEPEKSAVHPKHMLYNIDNCTSNKIVVVEGVTHVWRMGDNFAATLGTAVTEHQIKLLSKFNSVIFMFDSEKEAQQKARKAAVKLSALGVKAEVVDLELDRDPADLSEQEAKALRRELFL